MCDVRIAHSILFFSHFCMFIPKIHCLRSSAQMSAIAYKNQKDFSLTLRRVPQRKTREKEQQKNTNESKRQKREKHFKSIFSLLPSSGVWLCEYCVYVLLFDRLKDEEKAERKKYPSFARWPRPAWRLDLIYSNRVAGVRHRRAVWAQRTYNSASFAFTLLDAVATHNFSFSFSFSLTL